ncbi:hypothetical protein HD554DRAFT_2121081 [Boletus coccyginus]|nr:hypothetical protein HD554DRAFT_2121081 [Boletus coccyginus]
MDDLLIECPIHLDAVSINDILVFRCGHGFCEPCLEEHFSHGQSSRVSCPTCRKPIRRKEAVPLFLAPAQPTGTQIGAGSSQTADAARTRLIRELKEAKATHADCPGRFIGLHHEIEILRRDAAHHNQTIHQLQANNAARAREESSRMKEEMTKLQVESHKTSRALEQALKEVQVQVERVKLFQGYIEQYKHKCNLEKKKRKAIESANHHLLPRKEEDSLMVVDANAPDVLHPDGPDFGWLDEACQVKGDILTLPDDEDLELEKDEVQLSDPSIKGKQRFSSDWNLGLDALGGTSSGRSRKRGHGSRQVGGSKIVKVKMPVRVGTHPLALDGKWPQKLNSKN